MITQVPNTLFKYQLGSIHCSFMLYIYWCGIVLEYLRFLKKQIDSSEIFSISLRDVVISLSP
jgi:hypothetical protein